jgi:hypothetical protein
MSGGRLHPNGWFIAGRGGLTGPVGLVSHSAADGECVSPRNATLLDWCSVRD